MNNKPLIFLTSGVGLLLLLNLVTGSFDFNKAYIILVVAGLYVIVILLVIFFTSKEKNEASQVSTGIHNDFVRVNQHLKAFDTGDPIVWSSAREVDVQSTTMKNADGKINEYKSFFGRTANKKFPIVVIYNKTKDTIDEIYTGLYIIQKIKEQGNHFYFFQKRQMQPYREMMQNHSGFFNRDRRRRGSALILRPESEADGYDNEKYYPDDNTVNNVIDTAQNYQPENKWS